MQFLSQVLLLLTLCGLISASPVREIQEIQRRGQKSNIDVITSLYPGINWKDAVETCDDDQFDKLVESTRMGIEVVNALPDRIWESAAWNRYFLAEPKTYSHPEHSWIGNWTMYHSVIHNLERVSRYVREGGYNSKGRLSLGNQVTYTCKKYDRCASGPNKYGRWGGPVAFTMEPNYGGSHLQSWGIVFCPQFFQNEKIKYINDVTAKPKQPKDFPSISTYEGTVIHEWMHVTIFGYVPTTTSRPTTITDIDHSGLDGVADDTIIYGDYLAYKFARKYMDDPKHKVIGGGVNCEVTLNADSYALMFIYNWLAGTFGWKDDGSEDLAAKRGEEDDDDSTKEPTDLNTVDLADASFPNDCRVNDPKNPLDVTCDFVKVPEDLDEHDNDVDTHCDQSKTSGLPANVFNAGIYKHFCEQIDKDDNKESLTQLVDYEGNERIWKRSLEERTPPAKPDAYKNAWTFLTFEKKEGDTKCAKSCSDAFKFVANSPCGTTGGGMSSMSAEGSVGVGCGEYRYQIWKGNSTADQAVTEAPKPTLGKRHCYKKGQFGKTENLKDSKTFQKFNTYNADICTQASKEDVMNHESKPQVLDQKYEGVNFHFSISWIKDCISPSALNPLSPLADFGSYVRALDLFRDNAITCDDNDSSGAYIDAGCLRYDFKQEKS